MIKVSLSWIAEQVQGRLQGNDASIEAVSTDTRELTQGSLFIALRGQHFDAHEFVPQAIARGAVAAIVERPLALDCAQIIVSDCRQALGALGAAVKREVQPRCVAVTGSNGKTSVKEMLAAILARRGQVLATQGNFNNDIGAPLTLLRLTHADQYAVIELGANHPGEIAYTTQLVQPDVAIINNVSAAHIEGFGSVEGVARAKTEIFQGLPEQGLAITPLASEFAEYWQRVRQGLPHQTFGLSDDADVYASEVELDEQGMPAFNLHLQGTERRVQVQLPGAHNVLNALAAATAAHALGADLDDIAAGLASIQPVKGRLNILPVNDRLRLIDDSYNASVASTKAAVDFLASWSGLRIFVLGDMGELGPEARAYHEEVGSYALANGIDALFSLGVLSQSASDVFSGGSEHLADNPSGCHFSTVDNLVQAIRKKLTTTEGMVTVLVKGSRSSRMERVVVALQEALSDASREGVATC
ncbi:UDP-N-acetylmuramoyl-tripeptide--D-alanyl-D-alanine ligase [Idiomarina xiamenensis]|uniref:UDP-N-acetylmuramoyl-tripeptide--D-alanyl-D-alanine ligase n=1 Tax=Idiomarina xiamenensis 10-D-4 TaxID=740709 RepID=K2KBX1_9GAMM|nr:UDP-N-acetylmuramoyl-tripeptide--D-alanyl-D-alanine ligase [Idiomarina xiamenensis]EKE85338.1 UDP-N-acetylmuramyl pentapeptide synthase [Idiomarina xiamenensis 10-D-4]